MLFYMISNPFQTRLYEENMPEKEFVYFQDTTDKSNDTHTGPYCANTGNAAEFEQGKVRLQMISLIFFFR